MTTQVREVPTPRGPARLHTDRSRSPICTLVLGHGAGGGPDAPDLAALAAELPRQGITVIRVEQPWRLAGRRLAPAAAVLDECWIAVVDRLRPRTPLVLGGRSAGARCAARTAHHLGASGVVALAFPLHPPGRPERSRLAELEAVEVPSLVVQGERDAFGRPEEFPERLQVVAVPEADHGFAVPRRAAVDRDDVLGILVEATLEFLVREVVGNQPAS